MKCVGQRVKGVFMNMEFVVYQTIKGEFKNMECEVYETVKGVFINMKLLLYGKLTIFKYGVCVTFTIPERSINKYEYLRNGTILLIFLFQVFLLTILLQFHIVSWQVPKSNSANNSINNFSYICIYIYQSTFQ